MKIIFLSLVIFVTALTSASCTPMTIMVTPTLHGDLLVPTTTETPTESPQFVIPLTQVIPAQVQLNGVVLVVQEARLGECDLLNCPAAPAGMRYLRVILQPLSLPSDQSLDYKNLPAGIAIHDNTGTITPFNRLAKYAPATQQLILYFTVPQDASVFGLQWPGVAEIPLTVTVSESPTAQPILVGLTTTFNGITLTVPQAIASGASGNEVSRLDSPEAAWWEKTPGHRQINLGDYYVLQGKSLKPVIYVYSAKVYAELLPAAFESIHRLNNLFVPDLAISAEQLPTVPFFNAKQVFASNIQLVSFQNGRGVRFVTEYAQYPASANNADLFYEFQGLTNDGAYYVVAILPITFPLLAETSDAGAPLPPGGIMYPFMADPNADMNAYYISVTTLLNGASPESFSPTISQLDAMIQSVLVGP